jgi:predicted nucleic acid-binding protein
MYVALSSAEGLPLVTADARLVRMLAGTGHEALLLDEVTMD